MKNVKEVEMIPLEVAELLCAEIRAEAEVNWYTAAARWCWDCRRSAGGDPAKKGYLRKAGNRGCILINRRYQAETHPS